MRPIGRSLLTHRLVVSAAKILLLAGLLARLRGFACGQPEFAGCPGTYVFECIDLRIESNAKNGCSEARGGFPESVSRGKILAAMFLRKTERRRFPNAARLEGRMGNQ
jgi:hypothetical protein